MEFSFRVTLNYRDAQAFNDQDLQRAHDGLTKRLFDIATEEFVGRAPHQERERVSVEVEPI